MKWSWKLGTFAGIGVFVHATFSILIAWVVLSRWTQTHNVQATVDSVFFVLALFACVVLHEFGHALTAKRFGVMTRDITLLPIGGVARLERMPEKPQEEFLVAIAGPAVNVVIAIILYAILTGTGQMTPITESTMLDGPFLVRLMLVNVTLVLFNLLPAFPMDGGRILRAALAMRTDHVRATQIAAAVGQGMALLFGFLGFFFNPVLLFIALFVWIGAEQEASMAQFKYAFSGIPVQQAMVTEFHVLHPQDSLQRAVDYILAGSQQDFPVVRPDGQVSGILTRSLLMTALAQNRMATVGEVMDTDFQIAQFGEMLESAVARLQQCRCRTMPVMRNGALAGLLTTENIGEFMMIRSALDGRAASVPPALRQAG